MKIKLFITSLLIAIVLTGCKANYSITIMDDEIDEKFSVIEENSDYLEIKDDAGLTFIDYAKFYGEEKDLDTNYDALYSDEECEENCIYYEKTFVDEDGKVGFILENKFTFDDYKMSSIANDLIPGFQTTYDGRFLRIYGGSSWQFVNDYEYLDEVVIDIVTNYRVTGTNLQQIGKGKYRWTVKNEKKKNGKQLFISLDTKTKVDITEKESDSNPLLVLLIAIGALVLLIIGYTVYKRQKTDY